LEQEGDPALARLAVDADDRLVAAADVRRIERQIGYLPRPVRLLRRESFLDGVLVRAGESREHEIAHVRMTWMDGQLVAVLHGARGSVDVGQIELRIDPLG